MNLWHKSLAEGRWYTFSVDEQLGHIGSEVSRAIKAGNDEKRFQEAVDRALELFDFTLSDPRWRGPRLREIARARELFCDAVYGGEEYGTTLEYLNRYCYDFALAARTNR